MIEEIVYKIVNSTFEDCEKQGASREDVYSDIVSNLRKYLETVKVKEVKHLNFKKCSELDLIMYLIYAMEKQKRNYMEALENIQKIVDFKIDTHRDTLTKEEVDSLIDMYKIRINLK